MPYLKNMVFFETSPNSLAKSSPPSTPANTEVQFGHAEVADLDHRLILADAPCSSGRSGAGRSIPKKKKMI